MQLGLSESARVTTAQESRFRIDYPNSKGRKSSIIALDSASAEILAVLAEQNWNHARFLRYVEPKSVADMQKMLSSDADLEDFSGARSSLIAETEDADVIVMVISAGARADAAQIIGNAAFARNKLTTGLVLNAAAASTEDLMRTLHCMRPFAAMLVVSNGDDHVADMLTALRA